MENATTMLSKMLGKPLQYIMVNIETNNNMMFAGNNKPLAYVELKSIGLPQNKTSVFSAELCSFLENEINVQKDRIYIEFSDARRNMFGWNGGTF